VLVVGSCETLLSSVADFDRMKDSTAEKLMERMRWTKLYTQKTDLARSSCLMTELLLARLLIC